MVNLFYLTNAIFYHLLKFVPMGLDPDEAEREFLEEMCVTMDDEEEE